MTSRTRACSRARTRLPLPWKNRPTRRRRSSTPRLIRLRPETTMALAATGLAVMYFAAVDDPDGTGLFAVAVAVALWVRRSVRGSRRRR